MGPSLALMLATTATRLAKAAADPKENNTLLANGGAIAALAVLFIIYLLITQTKCASCIKYFFTRDNNATVSTDIAALLIPPIQITEEATP